MVPHESSGKADDVLRLVPEEARRSHDLFDVLLMRIGQRLGIGISREQDRGHHVHAHIGRLCREDRRNRELERVRILQLAVGIGILREQAA